MRRIIFVVLVGIAFVLSGCGGDDYRELAAELQREIAEMANEISYWNIVAATYNDNLQRQIYEHMREMDALTNPRLGHGLYANEIKAAFLENDELHAEIAEMAGFWLPSLLEWWLEPLTVMDRYVLFPRGVVSYLVDPNTHEITWRLEAYRLDFMGWRRVREAPIPRHLTDLETVTIRIYSAGDGVSVYEYSLEIPGESLWYELTQMWGIRDVWYVGDILHVDFHPRMEMAFNIGFGSLSVADAMLSTLFSLPNVAEIVFTLDGGPMMHGYLGFCLHERRMLQWGSRYNAVSGYVISIEGCRDFGDWVQIYIEDEHNDAAVIAATMATVFPRGDIDVGDFVTAFYPSELGAIVVDDVPFYVVCVIVPGVADGLIVSRFVAGMGTLEGYYICIDKDFVFAVGGSTVVNDNPVPGLFEWRQYDRLRLHDLGLAVIYSDSTRVNGRRHAIANEVFALNSLAFGSDWYGFIVPEMFLFSDFDVLQDMGIYVQGDRIISPLPLLYEDTIIVPIRAVAEALSAEITVRLTHYNDFRVMSVVVRNEELSLHSMMRVGSREVWVHGSGYRHLTAPALVVDGVLYVPVEFFGEYIVIQTK